MSLKTAFITSATLVSLASFAGQDPRLDYTFAAPKLDDAPTTAASDLAVVGQYAATARTTSKSVSASFRNAPVTDVLNWLQKQGVSFIVQDEDVAGKRVTLNVVSQPLDSVVDALATSLGGHWQTRRGIRVFRKGVTFFEPSDMSGFTMPPDVKVNVMPKVFTPDLKGAKPDFKFYGLPNGTIDKDMADKLTKELRESLKDSKADDPAFWERFSKELAERLQKELQKGRTPFVFTTPNGDAATVFGKARAQGGLTVMRADAKKFIESLTPAQKELQTKQGYLKLSDLTPEQRAMLNLKGDLDGNIVMTFSSDGNTVTIKSK